MIKLHGTHRNGTASIDSISTALLACMASERVLTGPDIFDLAEAANVDIEQIKQGWVSVKSLMDLLLAGIDMRGDEFSGLSPVPGRRGLGQLMSGAAMTQRNGLRALHKIQDFYNITSAAYEIEILQSRGEVHLSVQSRVPRAYGGSSIEELCLMAVYMYLCWFTDEDLDTNRAVLRRPNQGADFHPVFQCPVSFGARASMLSFPAVSLEAQRAQQSDDQSDIKFLARQAERMRRLSAGQVRTDKPAVVERVEALMERGATTAEQICTEMRVSEATMRRKLRASGASLRQIRQDLLRDEAVRLLLVEGCTVENIADTLGFAESASFRRAFRTWTGTSPRRFVEKNRLWTDAKRRLP